jgi:hypothetical protein
MGGGRGRHVLFRDGTFQAARIRRLNRNIPEWYRPSPEQ